MKKCIDFKVFLCPNKISFASLFPTVFEWFPLMSFSLPTFIPTCVIIHFFLNYNNLRGCKVVFYCSFDLHFLNDQWCWVSFHVLAGHLYIVFEELSIEVFSHFYLNWIAYLHWWIEEVFWFFIFLHIWDPNHLDT